MDLEMYILLRSLHYYGVDCDDSLYPIFVPPLSILILSAPTRKAFDKNLNLNLDLSSS